jgi:hypothetical protein
MHGRSLHGNRETSGLARVARHGWSTSGRQEAEADDERSRGVRSCRSSKEPYEQSWVTSGGARGAKGRNQGEGGSAQHMPGAGPGKCVPGAGPHTARRKAQDEGDVHGALPSHLPGSYRSLGAFRDHIIRLWAQTLRRRSQRHRLVWERMIRLANDWLPRPRILHPRPRIRFAVKHPR